MQQVLRSNAGLPARIGADVAEPWSKTQRVRSWLVPGLATVAAVVVCVVHAAVAGADTVPASGIGYLCFSLVQFGCAWAFWTRARTAESTLRIRWTLIAAASLFAGAGYLPSFGELIFHTDPLRAVQIACFNASEALYMLSAVLFFAGVARSIVIVDMLQALLFAVLRFNLAYSPATRDHFSINHLLFGQLVALFLFLVAMVACLGAASKAELNFLRTLSWFFGLRLVAFFLSNQVCYTWQHHHQCGLWDVPGTALLAGFAVYLLGSSGTAPAQASEPAPVHARRVLVSSLMPSFLALVNLMLGLFLLRVSLPLASVAISGSLICYVMRTGLLQTQTAKEKTALETRNEHLEGLAVRDPLTGIGNRRSLAAVYAQLQATASDLRLSLLVVDVDSFKKANDSHGHLFGDNVLVALARALEARAVTVAGSHCVRLGGDEFALLLPDIDPEEARIQAEHLRMAFGAHTFDRASARLSLSIGVASLEASGDLPLETLISRADEALYRAKLLGRDRVEVQPVWRPDESAQPTLLLELQGTTG